MHGWNTLQRLKACLYAIWGLDALFLVALIAAAQTYRSDVKVIGQDTVPSIIAAQHIKSALADMDANATIELLGKPGQVTGAAKAYEDHRLEAARALIQAAENIKLANEERDPILALQVGAGTYHGLIERTRVLHDRGDDRFLDGYREAARLMDRTLMPAADAVDKANREELDLVYKSSSVSALAARLFVLGAGGSLMIAVVWVQIFLSNRTRRTFNLALLAATLFGGPYLMSSVKSLSAVTRELKIARVDAFTSIHALWQARAVAYAAKADQSRNLLDAKDASAYQLAFQSKADALWKGNSGYLSDELNNITFPGERESAQETLQRFSGYVDIDKEIQKLLQSHTAADREAAVALCLGTNPGQSNYAFERFDAALGRTLDINQKQFDAAIVRAHDALNSFDRNAALMTLFMAALVFAGLHSRIREYQ